ncbi:MAG: M23 family metallopeptidase [Candidatus Uhrbacteria bacterium]|nr:M23 family metallopeptidase [Candidatus Uhrbacteria bacterium]
MKNWWLQILFAAVVFGLFWPSVAIADASGGFIYPVGDGSKPSLWSASQVWDNLSQSANDIGYYDIQPFCTNSHAGLDLNSNDGADCGDPIWAVADGEVVDSTYYPDAGGWGNIVRIRHQVPGEGDVYSLYAHLSEIWVSYGQQVVRGQQIGKLGTTGNSTSCHLHFGMLTENTRGEGYPGSCSTSSLYEDPADFIDSHPIERFIYDYNAVTCANEPTHNASWYYSCSEKRIFQEGDDIWVLLRLENVMVDHRFKAKIYHNGTFQQEVVTDPSDVTDMVNGWQYAHFWPKVLNASAGQWRFDFYLITRDSDSDGVYIGSRSATVINGYSYSGSAMTCAGPISGSAATNWVYTCQNPKTVFERGETVYGFISIDNVFVNHRFRVETYLDGSYQWQWTTGWSDVGGQMWGHNYFWPTANDMAMGNWVFRFYIDVNDGTGFTFLDSVGFVRAAANVPYSYDGNIHTCKGPITGGAETGWVYTCANPTNYINAGESIYAFIRVDDITADHRWKIHAFKNYEFQWTWQTDWSDVGFWGWDRAYFQALLSNAEHGTWKFDIYIDTGDGFQFLDASEEVFVN